MSEARAPGVPLEVGCVLARASGVLLVLTDDGPVRATYDATLLGQVARDRTRAPEPGEWVSLRRWSDGPLTVHDVLGRPPRPGLATVLPLHGVRRGRRRA